MKEPRLRCQRCEKPMAKDTKDTRGVRYHPQKYCKRCERIVSEIVRR